MELKQILDRFADGLHYVDATSTRVNTNKKTGKYKPGLTQLFENRSVSDVWHEAVDSLCSDLSLVDVRIDATPNLPLPVIARHKTTDHRPSPQSVVVLPECGAVVEFSNPAIRSHLVLTPRTGMGSVSIPRSAVFAFVDQIEQTL
jgi:hypothetical protein